MEDAIARICERDLGAAPSSVEAVEEGLLHDTYEVRCGGTRYVLKFADGGTDDADDALGRGLGCYRLLADTAVPVPQVVTPSVAHHAGRRYTLVERLPGETATLEVTAERARLAGRCLALIHAAERFDRPGRLRFDGASATVSAFDAGGPARRLREDLAAGLRSLRAEGMDAAATAVEQRLDSLVGAVPEAERAVLCHGDYSPDNLLFADGTLTGVLDFDRSYAGPGARDLAWAATAFWMHDPEADWPVRQTLYDGYREVASPGDDFAAVEPRLRVATTAEAVAGMAELEELSAYERGYYEERILEMAERLDG